VIWEVTERRYHGQRDGMFVVHQAGALRGPIETDDKAVAGAIADILNECGCTVKFTGMTL